MKLPSANGIGSFGGPRADGTKVKDRTGGVEGGGQFDPGCVRFYVFIFAHSPRIPPLLCYSIEYSRTILSSMSTGTSILVLVLTIDDVYSVLDILVCVSLCLSSIFIYSVALIAGTFNMPISYQ